MRGYGIAALCFLVMLALAAIVIMAERAVDNVPGAPSPEVQPQSTGNPSHDKLSALSETGQAIVLGQAVVGRPCEGTRAFYMGMDKERAAYWSVGCSDGRSYQIQIQPDSTGSTRALDCAVVKAINLSCFSKLNGQ